MSEETNATIYITLKQLIRQRLRMQYGVKLPDKALEAIMEEIFDWLNCAKIACIEPVKPINKDQSD